MSQQAPTTDEVLNKLRHKVQELHFHLVALDINITEIQHHLFDEPSIDPNHRVQPDIGLLQGLDQRQQLLLEILFAEAEMEIYLWRQWLDGPLLPRCAGCSVDGKGRFTEDEIWPMRRDSLFSSPNGTLMPLPLNVPRKITVNDEPKCKPKVRMVPRGEMKIDPGLQKQRSLIGLVKRLRSNKGTRSPVVGTKPG